MRRICVVTGTRAEYGLLNPLLQLLDGAPDVDLSIVASGAHLSEAHGMTVREIEADGFTIAAQVDLELGDDSALAIAASMGLGVKRFAEAFDVLSPELIVLLGDRYEMLAAAEAALVLRLPVAHIHGGERTEGTIDESIRHAITKMSHLHFTTTDEFSRRVIQLGEQPDRVFSVGAPCLDTIATLKPMVREELERSLDGFSLKPPFLLVTYHPVTLAADGQEAAVANILEALDAFPEAQVLFTGVNADTDASVIAKRIDAFVKDRPDRTKLVASLGHHRYLSAMAIADGVVGNSSSGILEAPAMGVPTVNIGERQQGRPRAASVIDCSESASDIKAAIDQALNSEMQNLAAKRQTPFGGPGAARKIFDIITEHPLDKLLMKRFHDLD